MIAMLVVGAGATPGAATPPPPPAESIVIRLPADQCRVPLSGTVRAYAQPVYDLQIPDPTIVRILAAGVDPALLVDFEHADDHSDLRPVATGVGLAGGDVRIAVPTAGRYRLRILMTGDAARTGRSIGYRLDVGRAMESGAAACNEASSG